MNTSSSAVAPAPAVLPPGLAGMLPGPELGVLLGRVDPARLSGRDAVVYLQARHRQLGYEEVMELAAIVQVGLSVDANTAARGAEPGPFAADEIRCALGWSQARARNRLAYAVDVVGRLPQVFDAQRQGRIDGLKTWAFADNILDLSDEHIAVVIERLLPKAAGWTAAQLVRKIRRLAADLDPGWLERRYRKKVCGRRVRTWVDADGAGGIGGYDLPADLLAAAERRLQTLARRIKRRSDPRTMDQLRADLMLFLLGAETDGMSDDDIVAWFQAHPGDPADLPSVIEENEAWVPDGDPAGSDVPHSSGPGGDDGSAHGGGDNRRADDSTDSDDGTDDDGSDDDGGPDDDGGDIPDGDGPDDGSGGGVPDRGGDVVGPGGADRTGGQDGGGVVDDAEGGGADAGDDGRDGAPADGGVDDDGGGAGNSGGAGVVGRRGGSQGCRPVWWAPAELRVRLSTLTLRDRYSGELAGKGLMPAVLARKLALATRDAEWRFVVVDDQDGRMRVEGITRHRPRPPPGWARPEPLAGGIVEIAVTESELAELAAEDPDWVNGYHRVIKDIARQVTAARNAEEADADRADADRAGGGLPGAGLPADGGRGPRRAGPRIYRRVQVRDRQCGEPFCYTVAIYCEQDHQVEYGRGGRTVEENLNQKCGHGHKLKDCWQCFPMGTGPERLLVWISRLGHGYWTQPPPVFDPAPLPHLIGPSRPAEEDLHDGLDPAADQPPVHVGTWGDEDPFDHVQTYLQARERLKAHKNRTTRTKRDNPPTATDQARDDIPPF